MAPDQQPGRGIERQGGKLAQRRHGGLRLFHTVGVLAVAVVGVIVAFWVLSSIAGVVWGIVKVAVVVAIVGGLAWLLARRRRRR